MSKGSTTSTATCGAESFADMRERYDGDESACPPER